MEVCAGAGGQALGLERAGFDHVKLVEWDADAALTLRTNRPRWTVELADLREFCQRDMVESADLLAGGVPCPPYSIAGKQLGADDERDLFHVVIGYAGRMRPRGLMIENVKGLLQKKFTSYREELLEELTALGYRGEWKLLNASDYGVPQLRPRSVLVALRAEEWPTTSASPDYELPWPAPRAGNPPTVGSTLLASMEKNNWAHASEWARRANGIAPTLVGGSKKHGGADLGPTRSKRAWAALGVDGHGLANDLPTSETGQHVQPRLTIEQAAILQGFPSTWKFMGRKTSRYRQVGNAFPPPVAEAVGAMIRDIWSETDRNLRARLTNI